MSALRLVPATTPEHFAAMSLIHALGWRASYTEAVPAQYMAQQITDDRWTAFFEQGYLTGLCNGILLYSEDTPVSCITYGPARVGSADQGGAVCSFSSEGYEGWGEIISFYTHPDHTGRGCGGILMEAALDCLARAGYPSCFVLVLRENEGARRFYARHGFVWDGTHEDIPFPPDRVCVDLRYVRRLSAPDLRPS